MASFKPSIYRKEALAKLSSPEELDRLMQITTLRGWLLIGGCGGVLLIGLLWGVFGKLTTTVDQSGTLTLSNPIAIITASSAGRVSDIAVKPDDVISAGQVLVHLTTSDSAGSQKTLDVTSPNSGRVLAVRTQVGALVSAGTPLISVETFDGSVIQPLQAIMYVPLSDAKQLAPGMVAQMSPYTAPREQFGYLLGQVQSVAQFEATRTEMIAVLKNDGLVDNLFATGAVFEVRVQLTPGADRGLSWSASHGPGFDLISGTPCQVSVIVRQEPPISRVFSRSS